MDEYIRSAEAFSRSSYQSVYIIDYFRQNFLYVSPNPMFLCGLSPEQMKELGYRFYLGYVPEDEQPMLLTLNKAGFSFYNDIPVDERKDWYISYDFHILNDGRRILVNHKLTPLAYLRWTDLARPLRGVGIYPHRRWTYRDAPCRLVRFL